MNGTVAVLARSQVPSVWILDSTKVGDPRTKYIVHSMIHQANARLIDANTIAREKRKVKSQVERVKYQLSALRKSIHATHK